MASDGFNRESNHAVEFITAAELQEIDTDPVLDRADYWQQLEGQR